MRIFILLILLSAASFAAESNPAEKLGALLEGARKELQSSTTALAKLRDRINDETLPLSQKLSELETKLLDSKKQYEQVANVLDTRNLDITNLKSTLKLSEDERAYVGTLLDEFVNGMETKLNPSELPGMRDVIDAAKAVASTEGMADGEKAARQLAAVRASLGRVKEIVGGAQIKGTAVNEQGNVLDGMFALVGPFSYFASNDGSAAGVSVQQSGGTQPMVKDIGEEAKSGITKLMAEGSGWLPIDATNGAALKALLHKTSLIDTYVHGGPIMHPLLLVSIFAMIVVIERSIFLGLQQTRRNPAKVMEILDFVEADKIEDAIKVGNTTKDFVANTLTYALVHREKSVANAIMLAGARELKRFSRGIPILDTCITLAPLLGLLGTVTGMMASFASIGGDLGNPGAITGGIAEALIATAFGIGIAVVAVIPFNILNAKIDDARHDIESAATRLELIMHTKGAAGPEPTAKPVRFAVAAATGGGGH